MADWLLSDASKNLTEVTVSKKPKCDFCDKTAKFNGKTNHGPWANMCEACFKLHGIGLGLGVGQRLMERWMRDG